MHAPTASNNDTPFCQQNVKLWVVVLAISAVLVLGFALVLAFEDGRFQGFGHGELAADSPAAGSGMPAVQPAAQQPQPPPPNNGLQGTPAAFLRPAQAQPPLSPETIRKVAMRASPALAQQLQASFNQVADKIRPCVVNINAVRPSRRIAATNTNDPRFIDPFDGVPDKMFGKVAYESVGSGVIVDPRGIVVTNDHLVSGALSIVVTRFNSKEHLPAQLIATDRNSDLAVLKLAGNGPYPAAQLGNSDKVEVGDWVLAVGNPFGLGHTVTSGIVSSRRSAIVISGVQYRDLLQTDAPINQGSSGGPLVDLNGKVIGINTAIYAPTGVFNGTGFAIPSNRVGSFVSRTMGHASLPVAQGNPANINPATINNGTGVAAQPRYRPYFGVGVSELNPALAATLGMPRVAGVFVNSVDRGSPADKAELRRGDVIVALAGQPVMDRRSLAALVGAVPPGQRIPVAIWRKGKVRTRRVKLVLQPGA